MSGVAELSAIDPIYIVVTSAIPIIHSTRTDLSNTITITHTSTDLLTYSCIVAATQFNGSGAGLTNIPPSSFISGGTDGQVLTKSGTSWSWVTPNIGSSLSLSSALAGFTLGVDGSQLTATDSVLQGFQKIQVQINEKLKIPSVTYLTGTNVLDSTMSIVMINSPTDCNLFLPVGINSDSYRIRNIGAGKATIIPNGLDKIENLSSFMLLAANSFDLVFYSGNWYIF